MGPPCIPLALQNSKMSKVSGHRRMRSAQSQRSQLGWCLRGDDHFMSIRIQFLYQIIILWIFMMSLWISLWILFFLKKTSKKPSDHLVFWFPWFPSGSPAFHPSQTVASQESCVGWALENRLKTDWNGLRDGPKKPWKPHGSMTINGYRYRNIMGKHLFIWNTLEHRWKGSSSLKINLWMVRIWIWAWIFIYIYI